MLLLSFLILVFTFGENWAFWYEDCGKKNTSIIDLESIDVSPSPIKIPGDVVVSAKITLLKDIPEDADIEVKITRKTTLLSFETDVPIPCLGGIGSCTKNICVAVKENQDSVRPFMPKGRECKCPLKAGVYEHNELVVPVPNAGPFVNLLLSGNYTLGFRILHKEEELACVRLKLSLGSK